MILLVIAELLHSCHSHSGCQRLIITQAIGEMQVSTALGFAKHSARLSVAVSSGGYQSAQAHRKLKQLVALLLWLEVLDGLQQNVNGVGVADALEARLRNMLQPVLHLRIRVAINLGCGEVV